MATRNTNLESTDEQSRAERAKDEAGRLGETAKQEAGQVFEDAKQQGRELFTDTADRIKEEARGQTQRASENLRSLSSEFRSMADSSQDQGSAVSWVRMGADRIESIADRLDSGGVEGLVQDVGDFARRNPTTFLAVTFSAGLIAGRLMKNMNMTQVTSGSTESGGDTQIAVDLASGSQQSRSESQRTDEEETVRVGS